MKLDILFVDDDERLRDNLVQVFNKKMISGHLLSAEGAAGFEEGKTCVGRKDYDIVILDLYNGKPKFGKEKSGLAVLQEIQKIAFMPVIFYSGLTRDLTDMTSEVVGVVNKNDGIQALETEMLRIVNSNIALIKRKVNDHIRITLRDYFWKTVHADKDAIAPVTNDVSIGYLLLRRLAHSLSKENIKSLLSDDKIQDGKAHPMEFYIYPTNSDEEYEVGEILSKDGVFYAVLTPSCDFVNVGKQRRKVEQVLLAIATPLTDMDDYNKYTTDKRRHRDGLSSLIESRKSDRYFFLPSTPFIGNFVLDFQMLTQVDFSGIDEYRRVAKLDTPFAQAMVAKFSRYYIRIGFPDLDADYVINTL